METKQVVIVIDFGTSNSGCLVGYYNQGKLVEGHLVNRMPNRSGYDYAKQPTFLLINKGILQKIGLCVSGVLNIQRVEDEYHNKNILIGANAFNMFTQDLENEKLSDWICFDNIKMNLYKDGCDEVKDLKGEKYNLIDVISIYICSLKMSAIEWIRDQRQTYLENQIQWVVTIPAVWNDFSKKKMELVNQKVFGKDIPKSLEPEGAAVHICFQQKSLGLEPGKKILVIDSGGGTTDIVGVEIKRNSTSEIYTEELINSIGIPTAGTNIDEDFWQYFVEELSGKVERFEDIPPVEKKRQLLYDFWDAFPNQKSIMMNAWFAIKHTYDFTKIAGTISYYLSNDYALWLYDNHMDVFKANQKGLGVMIRLERQKMVDCVFMPTFNKIVEVSQKAISKLSSKGMSFDYIFFAGGMSLMPKLSSLMVEKLGGVRKVFCADTHEASRFVCGGSILYGAAYMYVNGTLLRRRSKLYYYTSCVVKTPNRSIEDLVLYFVYEYNLSASKVREILKAEQNLFKPQLIIGEYYCTVLSPICRADEIYKNYNGSFIPVDKSNPLFVSRIWSSTGLTFLPGDIKGNSAQSNKIHFEGMIEGTYDSNKKIEVKIDFNKVPENSYFIVEYFYPSGEKVKELKIDRVETIIGH